MCLERFDLGSSGMIGDNDSRFDECLHKVNLERILYSLEHISINLEHALSYI